MTGISTPLYPAAADIVAVWARVSSGLFFGHRAGIFNFIRKYELCQKTLKTYKRIETINCKYNIKLYEEVFL